MQDVPDAIREIVRRLHAAERSASPRAREAEVWDAEVGQGTALALIAPGSTGEVQTGSSTLEPTNATGRPIWNGSTVWLDPAEEFIIASNAASLIWATWDEVGLKEEVESYDIKDDFPGSGSGGVVAQGEFYGDTGVNNGTVALDDPAGLLADVTTDKPMVLFSAASDAGAVKLVVAGTQAGGSGGGGDPWTGWPGPDPTTGVAPIRIFIAKVNEPTHVVGGDTMFDFNTGTGIGCGTAASTGSCLNVLGRAFIHTEDIMILGGEDGTFNALKMGPNIGTALVNDTNGVPHDAGTFGLNTFVSILNAVPTSGTGVNSAQQYADDQKLHVILKDNGNWAVIKDYDTAEAVVNAGGISARSDSIPNYTWGTGTVTILKYTGAGTRSETDGIEGVTVYNQTNQTAAEFDIVGIRKVNGEWIWDIGEC